jgi:hypothetical protein
MGASAGDLLSRDLACEWIESAGYEYEIAVAPPFSDAHDWRKSDASNYDALVFVCGPFGNGPPVTEFLQYFSGLPLIGLNLSMLEGLDVWNPFHLLLERDSNETARPDLAFLTRQPRVPVVGLILVHPQAEYGDRAMHQTADAALHRLAESREMAIVPIDTRLDENQTRLRTPGEIESLVAKTDAVITTRLHGMVLALKNGVPPLVVDPIAGGAKILRQANAIDWPIAVSVDAIDEEGLASALDFCLSEPGRQKAAQVYAAAVRQLGAVRHEFIAGLRELEA